MSDNVKEFRLEEVKPGEILQEFFLDSIEDLTPEMIESIVEMFEVRNQPKIAKSISKYLGQADVYDNSEIKKEESRIAHNFHKVIVNNTSSYILSREVKYINDESDGIDSRLFDELNNVFDRANEPTHNYRLMTTAASCGIAYELVYLNANKNIKLLQLESDLTIPIYKNDKSGHILAVIYINYDLDYIEKEYVKSFIVYTEDNVITYKLNEDDELVEADRETHPFSIVPVNVFKNNAEMKSDTEDVAKLIDSYDLTSSYIAQDSEYFANTILFAKGIEELADNVDYAEADGVDYNVYEEIDNISKNKIMFTKSPDADVKFVEKRNDDSRENTLKRLDNNIFKFAQVPFLMSDFKQDARESTESTRLRLLSIEQAVSEKESFFKQSLYRRLKLIIEHLNLLNNLNDGVDDNGEVDYSNIKIQFERNNTIIEGIDEVNEDVNEDANEVVNE